MTNDIKIRRGIQIQLDKELTNTANDIGVRLRTRVRDKLEETYKRNIKDTYEPTGERGKAIKEYNKDPYNTHRKAANYHHTGLFLKSIHPYIDGNTIKIEIDDLKYDDGTSTRQVYKWLTRGTRKRPKYPYYPVEGPDAEDTPWAKYVPTPKHNFNQLTVMDMNEYLTSLINDLENENSEEYKLLMEKYKQSRK